MTTKVVVEEAVIYFEARVHLRGQRQKISMGLRNIEMTQRTKSSVALRRPVWETSFTELIPWRAAPTPPHPFFLDEMSRAAAGTVWALEPGPRPLSGPLGALPGRSQSCCLPEPITVPRHCSMCGQLNNGPPKMSTSQALEPANTLGCTAKGN